MKYFFAKRLDDLLWERIGKPKPEWMSRRLREWNILHGKTEGIVYQN